jgi:hypothetical protein
VTQVSPFNDGGTALDYARLNLAGRLASLPQEWSLGAAGPEVQRAAPSAFSASHLFASRADDHEVPPRPAPRRSDRLVPLVCAAVFVAEFGIVFGLVEVEGLLPYSTAPAVQTETASPYAQEAAPTRGEPWQAPAPGRPPMLQPAEPLWRHQSSRGPRWCRRPATGRRRNMSRSRRSGAIELAPQAPRRPRTASSNKAGNDRYPYAEEIYRPGSRAAGW